MNNEPEQSCTDNITRNCLRGAFFSIVASFASGAYYALNVKVLPDGTMYHPQLSFIIFRVMIAFTFGLSSYAAWRIMKTK